MSRSPWSADTEASGQQTQTPAKILNDSRSITWRLPPQYDIGSILGRGSYGTVREAMDNGRDKLVAIKQMRDVFDNPADCKRLLRELCIMSALDHPHIVRIYDIVIPDSLETFDELFIVMEICDSDLKRLVRSDVTLEMTHVQFMFYYLLCGLAYLHSAGVCHRDLKPANCLVNRNCEVKICDFGLARTLLEPENNVADKEAVGQEEEMAMAQMSSMGGFRRHMTGHVVTRWYRAPEVILLEAHYTEAIDVWSAGCILAELVQLADGTPYEDRSALFPGTTCVPLSPVKSSRQTQMDQLSLIFELLGTPSDEDVEQLSRQDAKEYVRAFAPWPGRGLQSRFPSTSTMALDMLARMLCFNPSKRFTVQEALEHELLQEVRDPVKEQPAPARIQLLVDQSSEALDEATLRKHISSTAGELSKRARGGGG